MPPYPQALPPATAAKGLEGIKKGVVNKRRAEYGDPVGLLKARVATLEAEKDALTRKVANLNLKNAITRTLASQAKKPPPESVSKSPHQKGQAGWLLGGRSVSEKFDDECAGEDEMPRQIKECQNQGGPPGSIRGTYCVHVWKEVLSVETSEVNELGGKIKTVGKRPHLTCTCEKAAVACEEIFQSCQREAADRKSRSCERMMRSGSVPSVQRVEPIALFISKSGVPTNFKDVAIQYEDPAPRAIVPEVYTKKLKFNYFPNGDKSLQEVFYYGKDLYDAYVQDILRCTVGGGTCNYLKL